MIDNDSKIIGHLFESVGYKSESHLRELIENLSPEQALFFINRALQYCYSKNLFSMVETEILSKSIYLINSNFNKSPDSNSEGIV